MLPLTNTSRTQNSIIKELLDIYDLHSSNHVDVFFVADILYALGKTPTKTEIETQFGRTEKEGVKFVSKETAHRKISKILRSREIKLKSSQRSNNDRSKSVNVNKPSESEKFNEDEYRDYLLELTYLKTIKSYQL